MLSSRLSVAIPALTLLLCVLTYARQDRPPEKLGPKNEPAAMGSDYQPLLWRGPDAAFVLDTVTSSACQSDSSSLAASKSSNPDVQHIALRSLELNGQNSKKLKSMAKVIGFHLPLSKKTAPPCAASARLSQQPPGNLDSAYLDYLSKDNAAALARFQAEADLPPDSANFNLQRFVVAALPALTDQQHSIDALRAKLAPAAH